MKKSIRGKNGKRLPVAYFAEGEMNVCLELLRSVYGESEIMPVPLLLETDESDDYLSRKYRNHVEPLLLEVEGEVIFPPTEMFDSDMFILNYRRFYNHPLS